MVCSFLLRVRSPTPFQWPETINVLCLSTLSPDGHNDMLPCTQLQKKHLQICNTVCFLLTLPLTQLFSVQVHGKTSVVGCAALKHFEYTATTFTVYKWKRERHQHQQISTLDCWTVEIAGRVTHWWNAHCWLTGDQKASKMKWQCTSTIYIEELISELFTWASETTHHLDTL